MRDLFNLSGMAVLYCVCRNSIYVSIRAADETRSSFLHAVMVGLLKVMCEEKKIIQAVRFSDYASRGDQGEIPLVPW